MNGRGDETMTMFQGYAHMVDFFTSFDWWATEPHDELVNNGNYCLAKPGKTYAVYLPNGGSVTIQLQRGSYESAWFSAATGERIASPSGRRNRVDFADRAGSQRLGTTASKKKIAGRNPFAPTR